MPSEISELVVDTDSDEASVSGDISSVEGGSDNVPGLSQPQPCHQTASSHESSSSISSSASDEEDAVESGPGEQIQQAVTLQWTRHSCPQSSVTHAFTGAPRGKKDNEASHINYGSSPLSVFLLYFAEIISLLEVETNRYYHDYIDRLDDGLSPEPDVTEAEMFVFLALTIQMGHGVRDKLTDYWAILDQLYTPFYSTMMKLGRYLHILSYLHFTDSRNEPDRTDENYDRLWKIRDLFEILNSTFCKFYNPSENLAIDVIFSFKGRVVFRQYIPKKRKRFGIKIFKLCDSTGYTYDMKVYLGKDRQRTAQHLTPAHATVTELTRKVEGRGHKLYMDNFFSSPALFDDLAKKQIYCRGTVRANRRGMPQDLAPKTTKLKRGDFRVRTRADMMAIVWRDKRDIYMLTNIHNVPAEGNFCIKGGKTIKPQIVIEYNRHMGYVDKGNRMANSYSISRRTFKWTKKLFFHLLDLAILNSYFLHSSCQGKRISHRDFRFTLVRNMLAHALPEREVPWPLGRPPNVEKHVARLKICGSRHWSVPS